MSDARLRGAINQLAERMRHVEGRTQYRVYGGNPNGIVYGVRGTFCIDYQNYALYLNNSVPAGNSWTLNFLPAQTYTRQILWYLASDPLAVDTDVSATVVYRGADLALTGWDMQIKTAPTGASLIVDVNLGGLSLWNVTPADRPTILAAATSGSGTDFDTTTVTDGDVLKVDIDQVGSGVAGSQATLVLQGTANVVAT